MCYQIVTVAHFWVQWCQRRKQIRSVFAFTPCFSKREIGKQGSASLDDQTKTEEYRTKFHTVQLNTYSKELSVQVSSFMLRTFYLDPLVRRAALDMGRSHSCCAHPTMAYIHMCTHCWRYQSSNTGSI